MAELPTPLAPQSSPRGHEPGNGAAVYGEVADVIRLTPSLVRVVLAGDGLDGYVPTSFTDQYVNALFIPDGAAYTVPFDLDAARAGLPEHRPAGRRFTIRWWDPIARRLAIDFVVHGDIGFAGRWANNATVGDRLQFVGPTGAYAPSSTADWHLMVGDESALPAIGAALERVRPGVPAVVVAVVDGPDHELDLACPGDAKIEWVHRASDRGNHGLLLAAVEASELTPGTFDVFVHGEASEVRAVRRHLLVDRGVPRDHTSISPYWRRTFTDEAWRDVKREWLAEVERDA
jgi:NADPH-dependent ferric siderophore reductase